MLATLARPLALAALALVALSAGIAAPHTIPVKLRPLFQMPHERCTHPEHFGCRFVLEEGSKQCEHSAT